MKKFFIIILVFISANLLISCSKSRSKITKLDSRGKPTMLIFDSTTCHYCEKLHVDLKENKKLLSLEKYFTIYYIHVNKNLKYLLPTKNGNLELSSRTLAVMYGFRGGTPFIVFTNSKLQPITYIPGYMKPNELAKVFKFILSKSYKNMSLEKYLSKEQK